MAHKSKPFEFQIEIPNFADKVAEKCIKIYEDLPRNGKPTENEFTVLSGFVMFDRSTGYMEVVSVGTGTKCIGASKLLSNGGVLNDSHAEVIARRGLLVYLYDALKRTLQRDVTMFKLVNGKLELSSDYEFHLYTSQLPCGDASISPKYIEAKDDDDQVVGEPVSSKKRKAEDDIFESAIKKPNMATDVFRTGAKCLPHCEQDPREPGANYHLVGQVRTKPGRGERTLSVSCTDKISKWIHLGIQGSLLGLVLAKPIYLKSLIIGGGVPYNEDSFNRALLCRNPNFKIDNAPKIVQTSVVFEHFKSDTKHRPGPNSIIWINLDDGYFEVSAGGVRNGMVNKFKLNPNFFLSITKYKLYQKFIQLMSLFEEDTIKTICGEESLFSIPYNKMKLRNKEYYEKWEIVKRDFFKAWTIKPDIWDFCAEKIMDD